MLAIFHKINIYTLPDHLLM